MGEDHTYNGWKNYETWAMALWIDNDQGSYDYSREVVTEAAEDEEFPKVRAADALKEAFGEFTEDVEAAVSGTVWADLLNGALSEVDWYEIAENYLSEDSDSVPTD